MIELTEHIKYLPATKKPFSCDVVFIKTDNATWIFDVGMSGEAAEQINSIEGKKNIVISHFHPDHILNLARIKYDELYVSPYTKKYTLKGTPVTETQLFQEEPQIKIMELPSSHAKGCLMLICEDYAFLGDGSYCKEKIGHHSYNAQKLKEMIDVMESLDVKYFGLSHDRIFCQKKESVVALYKDIYKRRRPDSPIIDVEDFFNPDGSVKDPN